MTSAQTPKRSDSAKAQKSSPQKTPWHMQNDTLDLLRGKIEAGREMDRRQSKKADNTPSTSGLLNQTDPNLILDGKVFPE
jgi:hypothetical protein